MNHEFKKKNDYTIIIFYEDKRAPFKMVYVHNCYDTSKWLNTSQNHQNWLYMNVYVRRSGRYLQRFYKNRFIAPFPK